MAARQAANPRIWRNAPVVEIVDMADNNPSEDLNSDQAEDAEDSEGERDDDEEGDGEEDEDEEEEVQGEAILASFTSCGALIPCFCFRA